MMKNLSFKTFLFFLFFTILSCSNSNNIELSNDKTSEKTDNFVKEALELTKQNGQLILFEGMFGDINFSGMHSETESYLKDKFSDFNIEILTYEGSGPDGVYDYYVGWKDESVFTLAPKFNQKDVVEEIKILSKGVVDEYGVKAGMTYDQLNMLRPGGKIRTDLLTSQPEVIYENSSIFYSFCCAEDMNDTYTEIDMKSMKIQSVNWNSSINTPK